MIITAVLAGQPRFGKIDFFWPNINCVTMSYADYFKETVAVFGGVLLGYFAVKIFDERIERRAKNVSIRMENIENRITLLEAAGARHERRECHERQRAENDGVR